MFPQAAIGGGIPPKSVFSSPKMGEISVPFPQNSVISSPTIGEFLPRKKSKPLSPAKWIEDSAIQLVPFISQHTRV